MASNRQTSDAYHNANGSTAITPSTALRRHAPQSRHGRHSDGIRMTKAKTAVSRVKIAAANQATAHPRRSSTTHRTANAISSTAGASTNAPRTLVANPKDSTTAHQRPNAPQLATPLQRHHNAANTHHEAHGISA